MDNKAQKPFLTLVEFFSIFFRDTERQKLTRTNIDGGGGGLIFLVEILP